MTLKEHKEHKEQKALERTVSKIRKILQGKDVRSVITHDDGYTIVAFKNGQVFKMKGKAVTEALNGKPVLKPVKNYTVPKAGDKIGLVITSINDKPAAWKQVFVAAEFELFGERHAVRKTKLGTWIAYHVNTGYAVFTLRTKGGLQACVDGAIKRITEVGADKYADMIKDATKTIADCGELPIKDEAPE